MMRELYPIAVYLAEVANTCTAATPQGFKWAVDQDRWHERVASIPAVFEAAAADLGPPAVDSSVVRAVWERLLPGAQRISNKNPGYSLCISFPDAAHCGFQDVLSSVCPLS